MHMADALVSPAVAVTAGVAACGLIAIASKKLRGDRRREIIPLMGVMGAFVFAAQMINFSIPGTGSSGHLIGGILLSAVLGPWAAFITLTSVIIVQCLVFADGGLLALGCNILNMAATSCLLAYPLVYKPIVNKDTSTWKVAVASMASCVVALEIGAFLVTIETELSGVTELPFRTFLTFMLPIHLAIGAIEGLATASVLLFIKRTRPSLIVSGVAEKDKNLKGKRVFGTVMIGVTIILAGLFTVLASSNPDGLEWSIEKITGHAPIESVAPSTAVMVGYESSLSGIVGAAIVMMMLWLFTSLIFSRLRKSEVKQRQ